MEIIFEHLLPHPLKDSNWAESSLWKNKIILQSGKKVNVQAQSGRGKTTFTHLLAGLRKDYDGKVLLNGKNLQNFSENDWIQLKRKEFSFIFQDLRLFPELTVKENLLLKNQLENTHTEEEIKAFAKRLGIGNKWNIKCSLLSLGQQQRVAIIRALCQPFQWLIMDEPFSHLDAENKELAFALIQEVVEEQKAGFILTTLDKMEGFTGNKTLTL